MIKAKKVSSLMSNCRTRKERVAHLLVVQDNPIHFIWQGKRERGKTESARVVQELDLAGVDVVVDGGVPYVLAFPSVINVQRFSNYDAYLLDQS